jgi:hypothetical protein
LAAEETMAVEVPLGYRVVDDWEKLPEGWSHPDVAGVAVEAQDRVYLFCRAEHQVIVYDRDGNFLASWDERMRFVRPHGILIAPDGYLFLTDDHDHTVRKFTADGRLLLTLGSPGQPSDTGYTGGLETVTRAGPPFNRPTNVALAENGDLYVADGYGNARVHHFDPDGRLLHSWGWPGAGPGQFNLPHGICILPDGRVLVADRENDRIQILTLEGEYVAEWTHVQRPSAIVGDGRGRLFVTEMEWRPGMASNPAPEARRLGGIDRLKPAHVAVLDLDGRLLARWGGPDPSAPGSFIAPHSIAVDSRGHVYVAEVTHTVGVSCGVVPADCHTFQKFVPIPNP